MEKKKTKFRWVVVRKKASWYTDKLNDKMHFPTVVFCLFVLCLRMHDIARRLFWFSFIVCSNVFSLRLLLSIRCFVFYRVLSLAQYSTGRARRHCCSFFLLSNARRCRRRRCNSIHIQLKLSLFVVVMVYYARDVAFSFTN